MHQLPTRGRNNHQMPNRQTHDQIIMSLQKTPQNKTKKASKVARKAAKKIASSTIKNKKRGSDSSQNHKKPSRARAHEGGEGDDNAVTAEIVKPRELMTPEEREAEQRKEVERLISTLPEETQQAIFSSAILKKAYERTLEQLDATVTHFNPTSGQYSEFPDWNTRDKAINRVFQHMVGLPTQKVGSAPKNDDVDEEDFVKRVKDSPYAEQLLAQAGYRKKKGGSKRSR